MASILPFDELERFSVNIRQKFAEQSVKKPNEEDIIDELLDLFLLAYATGQEVTLERMGKSSSDIGKNLDEVMDVVDEEVAGKTWRERVDEYLSNGGTADDIIRIAETETHRIANRSALDTAKVVGAKKKTWATMLDDRVRTDHDYLEGTTVGINEDFYTWQGYHAPAPGMFGIAEEDVNCRCELIFS